MDGTDRRRIGLDQAIRIGIGRSEPNFQFFSYNLGSSNPFKDRPIQTWIGSGSVLSDPDILIYEYLRQLYLGFLEPIWFRLKTLSLTYLQHHLEFSEWSLLVFKNVIQRSTYSNRELITPSSAAIHSTTSILMLGGADQWHTHDVLIPVPCFT